MAKLILLAVLAGFSAVACTKARAATAIVMPELTPPPPPPRVVQTFEAEPVPTLEPNPIESALATPPPKAPPKPAPKPEPPKAEEVPILPERPVPAAPALTLKPGTPQAQQAQTEASIRQYLDRAARDLGRVKYAFLNADGRAQFDTARGFMQQAEEALKSGNLVFASKLADKAATMAAVLIR